MRGWEKNEGGGGAREERGDVYLHSGRGGANRTKVHIAVPTPSTHQLARAKLGGSHTARMVRRPPPLPPRPLPSLIPGQLLARRQSTRGATVATSQQLLAPFSRGRLSKRRRPTPTSAPPAHSPCSYPPSYRACAGNKPLGARAGALIEGVRI